MNVLVVSALLPYPLKSGGQVRLYNLLKELSKKYSITLLSFIREEEEKKYTKNLSFLHSVKTIYRGRAKEPRYLFRAVTGTYPWLFTTYDNLQMKVAITRTLMEEKIDILHIEPGYVFPSVPEISCPLVVAEHNVEHRVYKGYAKKYSFPIITQLMNADIRKMERWEKKTWLRANQIIAVSPSDAKMISDICDKKPIVVPNGVNLEEFAFSPHKEIPENFKALFVGDFRWIQNRDAVLFLTREIWPKIIRVYPTASLSIVGRELPKDIQSSLPKNCSYTPWIDTISLVYKSADMLLAPIRVGGGTKYKILEAMASGMPVVTTEKGIEGLTIMASRELFIVPNDGDWVHTVTSLVDDSVTRMKMVKNARAEIEKVYSWKTIAGLQDAVWQKAYETK